MFVLAYCKPFEAILRSFALQALLYTVIKGHETRMSWRLDGLFLLELVVHPTSVTFAWASITHFLLKI